MKKIILIGLISILLILPSAFATLNTSKDNLLLWIKPHISINTNNYDDSLYNRSLVFNGGASSTITDGMIGNYSLNIAGTHYEPFSFTTGDEFTNVHNFTYSFWLNKMSLSVNGGLTGWTEACSDDWRVGNFLVQYITATNRLRFHFIVADTISHSLDYVLPDTLNSYEMFSVQVNETNGIANVYIYRNESVVASTSIAYSWIPHPSLKFRIGSSCQPLLERWQGDVDEMSFWNTSRSGLVEEIYSLGQSGNEIDFDTTDTTFPVVNFENPTPLNNSFVDYLNIMFNISIVESNLDSIIFNFNGTPETNTFTNDFGNYWSLTKVVSSQGDYTYSVFVNDTSGNSFQSGIYTFNVDNVQPSIVYVFPASDNSTNHNTTENLNILGFNINLRNGTLNVYNSSNDLIYTNFTQINNPSFYFTNPLTDVFSGQPDGVYKFNTCFTDVVDLTTCSDKQMMLNNTPYFIFVPMEIPTQSETTLGIESTLSEAGNGLGTFLSAITIPLGNFMGYVAFLSALVVLIVGVVISIERWARKF